MAKDERLIGKLQSDMTWLKDGQDNIHKKIDKVIETLSSGNGKISGIKKELDDHCDTFNTVYKNEIISNSDFRKTSKAQIGIIGATGGAFIAAIIWIVEKFVK